MRAALEFRQLLLEQFSRRICGAGVIVLAELRRALLAKSCGLVDWRATR
jgi:hypothetical protein